MSAKKELSQIIHLPSGWDWRLLPSPWDWRKLREMEIEVNRLKQKINFLQDCMNSFRFRKHWYQFWLPVKPYATYV